MSQEKFKNMSGYKLALIYGYTPNLLGLCGPRKKSEKKIISDFILGKKIPKKKIEKIIRDFRAAYPYFQLISKSNNIKNPMNNKAVMAYWLGNEYLEKVREKDFKEFAKKTFSLKKFPRGSVPHHSFHVLNIGRIGGKLNENLLDVCLVKWGKVRQIANGKSQKVKVLVSGYEPLEKKNGKFYLGKPTEKEVVWNKLLAPELKVGDWVSIHWENVMEKLTRKDLENLKKYTEINLRAYSK